MPKKSKLKAPQLPQHVLETRYLKDLGERLMPPQDFAMIQIDSEDEEGGEEETAIERVGRDMQAVGVARSCACDPDGRANEEGFDEDSDDEDGWYCQFRDMHPDFKIHAALDHARTVIDADPGDFPKDIWNEILERYLLEYDKDFQVQIQKPRKGMKIWSPPSSPSHEFPPHSFQRLPREILVEIVFLVQVSDPHAHITLSHVDTSLRAFVNSTPLLWSRVDFLYPLPAVHLYLERSADTLLRVMALPPLYFGSAHSPLLEDVNQDECDKMAQFLGALWLHRHRIVSLHVRLDSLKLDISGNDGPNTAYDFLMDGSMVRLKMLYLQLGMWEPGLALSSDSIEDLHLHGPWTKRSTSLFSTRLKSLVVSDHPTRFSRIFEALQATPCLTSLTFRNISFLKTKRKEGSIVTLDQLESLSLIRVLGGAAEALGQCIVAPNLTSLTFEPAPTLHRINDWKDINELQLFPAPQPSVRRLDLTGCDAEPSWFNSVFQTFPSVTHLRIASSNLSDEHLLGAVAKRQAGRTALPDLQHLTIDNEFNGITHTLSRIASSRHRSNCPLKSMTFRGIPVDTDAARGDIQSIEEIIPTLELGEFDQGLDVYRDSDDILSEASSEGDWASGDEEVLAAFEKYGVPEGSSASDEDEENEDEE